MSDDKVKISVVGEELGVCNNSITVTGDAGEHNISVAPPSKPLLQFTFNEDGKVAVDGEFTVEASEVLSKFIDNYNANILRERLENHMLRSMIPNIIKSLIATKPEFGAPGSRDVDVRSRRNEIQRTINLLTAYERGDEGVNNLDMFRQWCIDESSSPSDKFMHAWELVERYIEVGGKTAEQRHKESQE